MKESKLNVCNAPPLTNRGVQKPVNRHGRYLKNADVDTIIDWFQCTLKLNLRVSHFGGDTNTIVIRENLEKILNVFNASIESTNHFSTSINGYTDCYVLHEKMKFFVNYNCLDMGINIMLSGYACRELEQYYSWQTLFSIVCSYEYNINRIDIARDFYNLPYSLMGRVDKADRKGTYVTRFRKAVSMYAHACGDYKSSLGHSITFGTRGSDVEIQFYDKLQERKEASYDVDDTIISWVRCEARYKRENAKAIFNMLCEDWDGFAKNEAEVLRNYIDFKVIDATRLSRCSSAPWWEHLLETTGKKKIAKKAKQSSIQKKRNWINAQVCKSLAMLYVIDEKSGEHKQFLDSVISDGLVKISKNDLILVNEFLKDKEIDCTIDEVQLKRLAERMYKI